MRAQRPGSIRRSSLASQRRKMARGVSSASNPGLIPDLKAHFYATQLAGYKQCFNTTEQDLRFLRKGNSRPSEPSKRRQLGLSYVQS